MSDGAKVFITGYRGFTGIHLKTALLARGYDVHGLVRGEPRSSFEHKADLLNQHSLLQIFKQLKPDYIVHLAAVTFVAHDNVFDFYNVNLLGTLNLLEAIEKAGLNPKKVLIASSANVYGNPTVNPITEEVIPSPINHYASSKLSMENMVKLWFSRFPIIITRPFNYTGPGQPLHFLVPKIVEHFRTRKKTIRLGNIDIVRDISDIQYVVECYIRLLESCMHSDVLNICSGIGYSLNELLKTMEKISNDYINIEIDSKLVRSNEIKQLIGSNQKFNSLISGVKGKNLLEILTTMYEH